MPRIARIVVPGGAYHITRQGNRREDVFFTDADRGGLGLLGRYAARHGLAIKAYCLMSNHTHRVAFPAAAESLCGALKPVHLRYAQHVNWTRKLCGRLWQGGVFSCALDDAHYRRAERYVERNLVRAGLVARAEDYPWSSAAAHCGQRHDSLVAGAPEFADAVGDWTAWLRDPEDEATLQRLRLHTRTGRPLGGEGFLSALEGTATILSKP